MKFDSGQTGAVIESTFPYAHHAVADSDGDKAGAVLESITSDARHTVGNVN